MESNLTASKKCLNLDYSNQINQNADWLPSAEATEGTFFVTPTACSFFGFVLGNFQDNKLC